MARCYVNGALVEDDDARISALDHGLVVGDGIFETVLLWNGRPFALGRHLDRLERSAAGLGLSPPDRDEVRAAVEAVVAEAGFTLGRIRITVTDGRGPLGSGRLAGPQTLVVAIAPDTDDHDAPTPVLVVPFRRNERGALTGLKTTSYGENVLALAYAEERGASEAIFANTKDLLCEGTGSNVFVVRDGELFTPPLSSGCLAGITRALVLETFGAEERDLPVAQFTADGIGEAFLTSSIRGVQPISAIDGVALGASPGPVTAKAAAAYLDLLSSTPEP